MPFFSVIIPSFNRAHILPRALESVLSQSFKDFEVIVIDDGSSDDTSLVLKRYEQIRYFKTNNLGVSHARNFGAAKAQGEWLCFLDSDDEWLEGKLQMQFDEIANNTNVSLVHTEETWVRNGKVVNQPKRYKKSGEDLFLRSLEHCLISPSTTCIRKKVFEQLGGFDESLPCCEDYDLWIKVLICCEVRFINTALIKKYGGHKDQLSMKYVAMDYFRVKSLESILKNFELSLDQRKLLTQELLKKCPLLLKGFLKYGHQDKYHEVLKIQQSYSS